MSISCLFHIKHSKNNMLCRVIWHVALLRLVVVNIFFKHLRGDIVNQLWSLSVLERFLTFCLKAEDHFCGLCVIVSLIAFGNLFDYRHHWRTGLTKFNIKWFYHQYLLLVRIVFWCESIPCQRFPKHAIIKDYIYLCAYICVFLTVFTWGILTFYFTFINLGV